MTMEQINESEKDQISEGYLKEMFAYNTDIMNIPDNSVLYGSFPDTSLYSTVYQERINNYKVINNCNIPFDLVNTVYGYQNVYSWISHWYDRTRAYRTLTDYGHSRDLLAERYKLYKQKSRRCHRKPRQAYTSSQIRELEREFQFDKYVNVDKRQRLSDKLGLSETQVKTWFQNRRTKLRKQMKVQMRLHILSNIFNLTSSSAFYPYC